MFFLQIGVLPFTSMILPSTILSHLNLKNWQEAFEVNRQVKLLCSVLKKSFWTYIPISIGGYNNALKKTGAGYLSQKDKKSLTLYLMVVYS
jgi:hypothetical protein